MNSWEVKFKSEQPTISLVAGNNRPKNGCNKIKLELELDYSAIEIVVVVIIIIIIIIIIT